MTLFTSGPHGITPEFFNTHLHLAHYAAELVDVLQTQDSTAGYLFCVQMPVAFLMVLIACRCRINEGRGEHSPAVSELCFLSEHFQTCDLRCILTTTPWDA